MDDKPVREDRASEELGAAYSDAFYRAAPQTSRPCYGYSPAQWSARASEEPADAAPKNRRRGSAAMFTATCILCILVAALLGLGGVYLVMQNDTDEDPVSDRELYNNVKGAAKTDGPSADSSGRQQRKELTAEAFGLGLTLAEVSPGAAQYYDMVQGVYVVAVEEKSRAAAAGLMPGDVITALDSEEITGSERLLQLLGEHAGEASTVLTVWRDGGELTVLLQTQIDLPAPPSGDPGASS